MKRIVKIASVLAAVAVLASCSEKESPISGNTEVPGGKSDELTNTEIVASFEATKVSYEEQGNDLKPSWEVGDVVLGLGDGAYAGETYWFKVESINEDKSAKLVGSAHANCNLHLIYCPGVSASKLTVDYTAQAGAQKTMPAVMFSDGKVESCKGTFKFRNAGAIIGISAVKGVPEGEKITKITISGANLSAANIALDGSTLKLKAAEKTDDAVSVEGLDLTVTDANGTLSSPVYIAVPAGAKIANVLVLVTKEPAMKKPSATPQEGVDYVTIAGIKWAKWNVGANSQTDYGWYFAWAGTEGYVYKNSKWVSASGVDTYYYTLSSVKTAVASDYLYVKTQSFTRAGFRSVWARAPYYLGSDYGWTKYIPADKQSYWNGGGSPDNKLVLDPEDDAATVNWGGTWRMPTSTEFKALKDATYWAWDATDKGYYVFSPDASHTAGTRVKSIPGDLNKTDALLFFPASGYGSNASLNNAGSAGYYWSSTLESSVPAFAYILSFSSGEGLSLSPFSRGLGLPVRPVSD